MVLQYLKYIQILIMWETIKKLKLLTLNIELLYPKLFKCFPVNNLSYLLDYYNELHEHCCVILKLPAHMKQVLNMKYNQICIYNS